MSRRPVPSTPSTDRSDPLAPPRGPRARVVARTVVLAAALDAACVLGFAAAGRSSHARDGGLVGVLGTAWPFLAAAALGWLAVRAWRTPHRPWPTGVAVWAVAWLGGMALRSVAGDGTAPSFVVVAGLVLGAGLVGWRVVATALSLAGRRRRETGPARAR